MKTLTQTIVGCARCHGDGHEDLVFEELVHAHEPEGIAYPFTYWTMCPTVRQPILLAIIPES